MNRQARGRTALLAMAGLITGLLTMGAPAMAAASPGTITTVAGGPGRGTATKVFQVPIALAAGQDGAVYVASGTVVRDFSNTKSFENAFAGNGGAGYSGNGRPATGAELSDATGLATDASGNVIITDSLNQRIRVVAARTATFYGQAMTAGDIYTVAGDGKIGFSGDGGPALSAEFQDPQSATVDAAGNLVIADHVNVRIRVVAERTGTFYGQAMTAGDIYTVAGNGSAEFTGDGGPATGAGMDPSSATVDPAGNILIADFSNHRVRVVAAVTGTFYGQAMTAGDIYTVAGNGKSGIAGDGGPATGAQLNGPEQVAVDMAGNLAITNLNDGRVRVVAVTTGTFYGQAMTAGNIYTVAGDRVGGPARSGGLATSTNLKHPDDVTFDSAGNLVIGDTGYERVWVVAARTGTFYGRSMTADHIYIVAGNGPLWSSGSGGKATSAELYNCCKELDSSNVAVDGGNYVLISSQQAWFIANTTGTHFGRAMTAGDIYVVAGNGFEGYSGDGGPATSARFLQPAGVAVDQAGNLAIADTDNQRIRVVAATAGTFYGQPMTADDVYTVAGNGISGFSGDGGPAAAAELASPAEVAVDGAGNLVIADSGNNRVRVVAATSGTFYGQAMTAGDIYTVAGSGTIGFSGDGGPATAARLATPDGVAVDGAGNLVIADSGNTRVRVVAAKSGTFYGQAMTAGDIYVVAGSGTIGFSGDGGPATAAELGFMIHGVAVDGAGNLVIADSGNNRVRVVAAKTGTFYGVAMTAHDIYTVAGNGKLGLSGDGGPATKAELAAAQGVVADGAGNLVIADSQNARVRVVTG